jgi:hypothetical protein
MTIEEYIAMQKDTITLEEANYRINKTNAKIIIVDQTTFTDLDPDRDRDVYQYLSDISKSHVLAFIHTTSNDIKNILRRFSIPHCEELIKDSGSLLDSANAIFLALKITTVNQLFLHARVYYCGNNGPVTGEFDGINIVSSKGDLLRLNLQPAVLNPPVIPARPKLDTSPAAAAASHLLTESLFSSAAAPSASMFPSRESGEQHRSSPSNPVSPPPSFSINSGADDAAREASTKADEDLKSAKALYNHFVENKHFDQNEAVETKLKINQARARYDLSALRGRFGVARCYILEADTNYRCYLKKKKEIARINEQLKELRDSSKLSAETSAVILKLERQQSEYARSLDDNLTDFMNSVGNLVDICNRMGTIHDNFNNRRITEDIRAALDIFEQIITKDKVMLTDKEIITEEKITTLTVSLKTNIGQLRNLEPTSSLSEEPQSEKERCLVM